MSSLVEERALARDVAAIGPVEAGQSGPELARRVAGTALFLGLAGSALFDRAFGVVGVPGAPLYVTEIVLGLGLLFLVLTPRPLDGLFANRWLAPLALIAFGSWGALRLAGSFDQPLFDALRDSALVYYCLFAFVAYGLTRHDPRFRPAALIETYGRFVPVLLLVAPIRILFASLPSLMDLGPTVPGSDVGFLGGHRPGNLSIQIGLAVVFLAVSRRRTAPTVAGIIGGLMMILVLGTQNRGGMLAAVAVIVVAYLLWGRRVRLRLAAVAAVLAALLVVAWSLNLKIEAGPREVSVAQLVENVESLTGRQPEGGSDQQLADTVDFRSVLWERAGQYTAANDKMETGWGFGMNLGARFLPTHEDQDLRSPHNSHLDILFRLGIVGLALWITVLVAWGWRVGGVARRLRPPASDRPEGRVALFAMALVGGALTNAFLDPTLEGPVAAIWFWCAIGFGMAAWVDASRAGRQPLAADERDPYDGVAASSDYR
jgi:hypothetical protein